jgi:hypothetical protein
MLFVAHGKLLDSIKASGLPVHEIDDGIIVDVDNASRAAAEAFMRNYGNTKVADLAHVAVLDEDAASAALAKFKDAFPGIRGLMESGRRSGKTARMVEEFRRTVAPLRDCMQLHKRKPKLTRAMRDEFEKNYGGANAQTVREHFNRTYKIPESVLDGEDFEMRMLTAQDLRYANQMDEILAHARDAAHPAALAENALRDSTEPHVGA